MNYYNLTNPQKSIWQVEEYYKGTNINNICAILTIKEDVDLDKLNKALNVFIQNNKSFSLNFKEENGKTLQYFTKQEEVSFETVYLKNYEEAQKLAHNFEENVFDIYSKRLYKFILFKLENGHGGILGVVHHIISDAATFGIMGNEIVENYKKILENEDIVPKEYSYEDYIQDENEYMNSIKFKKDEEYWNNLYNDVPEVAIVPSMLSNKSTDLLGKAERKNCLINKDLLNEIANFCRKNKISNFNFFMAVYAIYLSKITSLNDFVIGTPILNRANYKEKHTTGMFINTAPLRIKLSNNISFLEFVKQIASSSLNMLRYQKYPYEILLENLRKKEKNLPALFDVMLSYQITKANDKELETPYEVEWLPTSTISNGIVIHLHDNNDEGTLNISYDYQLQKYEEKDIQNMHNRILHIISQVLENENLLEKDIEIVTEEEKNQILYEFNDTFLEYDKNKTVIDYFEEQVEKTPDNIAIVFHGNEITYSELNKRVNSLAKYLRNNHITNNSIVGVMLNRSLEMITSILAVLKSGGAYIPIDPEYPDERISYMLSQSKSPVLILQKHLENKITNMNFKGQIIYADYSETDIYSLDNSNLDKISIPSDLSYIIYTSGSTGNPKGVMLTQQNFSNFIASMFDKIDYLNDDIPHSIVSITTVSFDIFAFETLVSLCSGLKLFITDEIEQKATIKLEKLLVENNIEIIQSTPSVMNFHLENSSIGGFSKLKYVMLAGEQLPKQLVDKIKNLSPNCTIYDGYGPSETTIFSAVQNVTNLDHITIGKPIANTQFYIFNENLSLLPPNTVGEIYISGDGVGLGYLDRDDLTKKSYIPNPFKANSIMYKTGDLGLWTSNGVIECMGRVDHQVKLRGLRIELGEIEECINSFDVSANIKSAVIVKDINGRKALNAFISSASSLDIDKLKVFLSSRLPRYMLPNTYTFIDKLPFTPNGKIDRKALLNYQITTNKKITAPKNDINKYLIEEIKHYLKLDDISIDDSFFDIGGDSLVAITLCSKISGKYNIKFTVKDIFEHPTIKDMSDLISTKATFTTSLGLKKIEEKEYYHLSSAQKRIYYSSKMTSDDSCLYNVPGAIIFNEKPNIHKLNECFQRLIKKHSSLRTYFEVIGEEVYQKIARSVSFRIEELSKENENIEEIMKDFVKPFDLSKAPLLRACLVSQKDKYLLLFDIHHIICDGTSLSIFTKELSKLYNEEPYSNSSFNYIDYAEWEFEVLKSQNLKESKEFWLNEFKADIPILHLPTDYVRPSLHSYEGSKIYKKIDAKLAKEINNLAKRLDVSNFMLLLSIYYILLFKYSNQEDIVVGSPTAARNSEELLDMIGMFVNVLPLKNHIESSMTFSDFLNTVKTNCIDAFDNQLYPFDELVTDLGIIRDTSRNPLFDTSFTYQNNGISSVCLNNLESSIYIPDTGISKFDISLEVMPQDNGEFTLTFEYCTKLFKKETVEGFANHFINLINHVLDNFDRTIADIDILSEEEMHKILYEFNNSKMDYPKEKTIIQLFEEQVERTPNNIAVVIDDKKLTYKELNEKANCLAENLIKNNVKYKDVVGVFLPRSIELVISIFAILKCGRSVYASICRLSR